MAHSGTDVTMALQGMWAADVDSFAGNTYRNILYTYTTNIMLL